MKEPVSLPFGGDPKPAEVWYIKGKSSRAYAVISVQRNLPARDIVLTRQRPTPGTQ